ncbi:transglutaminase family protein [Comamonadaceae bacterium G21597-S1]|nr:transglutaminase family protein [Comamonadaceae bacterium G21597-S1]
MSIVHDIVHTTTYHYREPVRFGVHRVMFRPRDSHDQRVLATDLQVSPQAEIRLIQDVYSNSIALVQPQQPARELRIVCSFSIEHVPGDAAPPLAVSAQALPFSYAPQEWIDLAPYLRPHTEDPDGRLIAWAHQFLDASGRSPTFDLLARMNAHVASSLRYVARDEEGTQTPLRTQELGSGSCRDYALLMMEAVRRLGIAARFVSGYLYDESLDADGEVAMVGSGVTHAWLQVFLPGAGWITYDPTNNLIGGSQLIRVAVVRDPSFAAPISGIWYGEPDAYKEMNVTVQVTRRKMGRIA